MLKLLVIASVAFLVQGVPLRKIAEDAESAANSAARVIPTTDCAVCIFVTAQMESADPLLDEEDVDKALQMACKNVFPLLQPGCLSFVQEHGMKMRDLILQNVNVSDVCTAMKMCRPFNHQSSKPLVVSNSIQPVPYIPVQDPTDCACCERLLQDLDSALMRNSSQQDVINDLEENVCNKLGPSLKQKCQDAVEEYVPQIMNYVAGEIHPQEICSALQLCPGRSQKGDSSESTDGTDPTDCACCERLLQDLDSMLLRNSTQQEIINDLEDSVCNNLGPLEKKCDEAVEEYIPQIMNYIGGEINPAEVCSDLHVCPSLVGGMPTNSIRTKFNIMRLGLPLLGQNPCTRGPSYWCKSEKTASQCSASQYCYELVWSVNP